MKSAWADIERFKEQKNHDLKEALISYAVMQISMCKKVRVAGERLAQCICPVSRGADAWQSQKIGSHYHKTSHILHPT